MTKDEMRQVAALVSKDTGLVIDPQFVGPRRVRVAIIRENKTIFVVPPMSYIEASRWLAAFTAGWNLRYNALIADEFGDGGRS